jgi:putative ATP-binding cassette transporter
MSISAQVHRASSAPSSYLTRFLVLATGFWHGSSAMRAVLLTVVLFACLVGQVGLNVATSAWQRYFFDGLEARDTAKLTFGALILPALVLAPTLIVTALFYTRMTLQVRWREWITERLMGRWLSGQRYYRLRFLAPDCGAPEFRIADDVRLAVDPLVDFAMGLTTATLTAVSFAAILWTVAGSLDVTIGGSNIHIPGYMALAAFLYAALASLSAYLASRPLVRKVDGKNEAEANFRADMTRLRENAESIALIRGDRDELQSLRGVFGNVLSSWFAVIRQHCVVNLVVCLNGALMPVIPLLLVTPKYLSGELSMGAVVQVVGAFAAVQQALIWFVENAIRVAEWCASARRVISLDQWMDRLDTTLEKDPTIATQISDDGCMHIEGLTVRNPEGKVFVEDASLCLRPGQKLLMAGESGSGKSTLIRAVAGLWPWGRGKVQLPSQEVIAFVPQRPYVPAGSLRRAILYPQSDNAVADNDIISALESCGLDYLAERLDEEGLNWDQILSGGERQRLAFCRLLIHKPKYIFMDEATSALDEQSHHKLMSLLRNALAEAAIISVGHRPGMEKYHDRGVALRAVDAKQRIHRLVAMFDGDFTLRGAAPAPAR